MSIRIMTLVWDVRFPTQSQLLIALKLADFANDVGGSIYPSRNRLAEDAQCSPSTVKNTLRMFREIGLIHVLKEGGNGPRDTTEYALNIRLLTALSRGECTIDTTGEEVEIKWVNKGAEFDPLDDVRGQTEPLRGQNNDLKGVTALPPIHHKTPNIDSSGACARASDESARFAPAKARLIRHGDPQWTRWIIWADTQGKRSLFEDEGGMVVFGDYPGPGTEPPKLPPRPGTQRFDELEAERTARLEKIQPVRGKAFAQGPDA